MSKSNNKISVIEPSKKFSFINLREIYQYKDLLWTLVERDIKVRYKQTVIGGLWAILQPFLTMIIFTIFFGSVAKISSEGTPYAIFSYSGLILWTYFTSALGGGSGSLIGNKQLVSKVYFPRLIIPLSKTIVGLLDYAVALIVVFGLMIYFKFVPTLNLLLLPIILFLTWLLVSGLSFWLSAFNVKYRDVRYAVPFFIKMLLFITPVIYPISMVGKYSWLLKLNPMTGLIEAHRAVILAHQPIDWGLLGISSVLILLIFVTGGLYFKSVEKYFADII